MIDFTNPIGTFQGVGTMKKIAQDGEYAFVDYMVRLGSQ